MQREKKVRRGYVSSPRAQTAKILSDGFSLSSVVTPQETNICKIIKLVAQLYCQKEKITDAFELVYF